jgi:hypothetical protein
MSSRFINLLHETITILNEHGKPLDDIDWVGSKDLRIPMVQFLKLADVEYNNGYGGEEVYMGLLVVGNDWWLERHTYDGSEWWEHKSLPTKPNKTSKVLGIVESQDDDVNYDGLHVI